MNPAVFLLLLCVSLAANLALLLQLLAERRAARNRYKASACPKCGYDARTTLSGRCPECGDPIPSRSSRTVAITHCSFCGKSNRETGPQAEGPSDAYICAPCIELCHNVILANRQKAIEKTRNRSVGL